jgi:hypothetical protein
MLQDLKPASFSEHLNTPFRLALQGGPIDLELYDVKVHEPHPGPRADPFSVFFRGPRSPVLPQGIYRLEHEKLGTLEIFLVPVGPDGKGMGYEAVFN